MMEHLEVVAEGEARYMILVNDSTGIPSVAAAWVGGHRVYERHDGTLLPMGDRWAAEAAQSTTEASYVP